MLRIGNYIGLLYNAFINFKRMKGFDLSLFFKIIANVGNSLYMLSDHILLLNKIGAYKFNLVSIDKVGVISDSLWGVECVSNIIYDIVDYLKNITEIKSLNQSLKKIKNKQSEGKFKLFTYLEYINLLKKKAQIIFEQHKKIIDLARCIADLPVRFYIIIF